VEIRFGSELGRPETIMFAQPDGHDAGETESPLARLGKRKQGDLSFLGPRNPFGHSDDNVSINSLVKTQNPPSLFVHDDAHRFGHLTPNALNVPLATRASNSARPVGDLANAGTPSKLTSNNGRLGTEQRHSSNKSRVQPNRTPRHDSMLSPRENPVKGATTHFKKMVLEDSQRLTNIRQLFSGLDAERRSVTRLTDLAPPPPPPNPTVNASLLDDLDRMEADLQSGKGMIKPNFQTRDFASAAAAANPSDCSFFIHYTLSEDRTGTQEEVMSRRLAPLVEKSRSKDYMVDSEVKMHSEEKNAFAVSRETFDEYRRSLVSSISALRSHFF
jgi:hypothetical protein